MNEQKHFPQNKKRFVNPLPASFEKYDHYYKTEICVTGVTANDISVLLHDHLLEVMISEPSFSDEPVNRRKSSPVFKLPLPGDADMEFGSAEYRDNKLTIYLSRFADPLHCTSHELVVYS